MPVPLWSITFDNLPHLEKSGSCPGAAKTAVTAEQARTSDEKETMMNIDDRSESRSDGALHLRESLPFIHYPP